VRVEPIFADLGATLLRQSVPRQGSNRDRDPLGLRLECEHPRAGAVGQELDRRRGAADAPDLHGAIVVGGDRDDTTTWRPQGSNARRPVTSHGNERIVAPLAPARSSSAPPREIKTSPLGNKHPARWAGVSASWSTAR
jgi:hypothetical protein